MANIGAEVGRTIKWKNKNNPEYETAARNRALELIDLTIRCQKESSSLKELTRLRELFVDFTYDNNWKTGAHFFDKYFYPFTLVANHQIYNN